MSNICYMKSCVYNKGYSCTNEEDVVKRNTSCSGFVRDILYKDVDIDKYYTDWHLCTKEESQDVMVQPTTLIGDNSMVVKCCTCRGVIFSNLTKEEALDICKKFNFNIIK